MFEKELVWVDPGNIHRPSHEAAFSEGGFFAPDYMRFARKIDHAAGRYSEDFAEQEVSHYEVDYGYA